MPKICDAPSAGAKVVLQTRDEHCPAHVHAFDSGQSWEIKVLFAYAGNDIQHLPMKSWRGVRGPAR